MEVSVAQAEKSGLRHCPQAGSPGSHAMSEPLMRSWSFGFACTLLLVLPAITAAASEAPPPQPAPLMLSTPLPTHALWAGGYGDPTSSTYGAWVSSDGKRVTFFTTEPAVNDGRERTLVVKDVDTDSVVFQKLLFSQQESEARSGPDLERLGRTRAWEARPYLEQDSWQSLPKQELSHYDSEYLSEACYEKQVRPKRALSFEGLKISYQEPRVRIWSGGKKVLDRGYPAWRMRKEGCKRSSPAWLSSAFVSREHGVVLLEFRFCGSDACDEPPPAFHVLRIPKSKPRAGSASGTQAAAAPKAPFIGYENARDVNLSLYAIGFPAISEDGALVAVAETFPDGARGDPNLLITIRRPRTGEIAWKLSVLDAGEVSAVKRSLPLSQELDKKVLERIGQVNAYVGQTRWVPLKEQPLQPMVTESCQQAPTQTLKLPELELTFSQGQLVLEQAGGSPPIERKLSRAGSTMEAACTLPGRTFLDAAYVDPARGVALLRLTTCGDEACSDEGSWYEPLTLR
jgi:hypothetical protein